MKSSQDDLKDFESYDQEVLEDDFTDGYSSDMFSSRWTLESANSPIQNQVAGGKEVPLQQSKFDNFTASTRIQNSPTNSDEENLILIFLGGFKEVPILIFPPGDRGKRDAVEAAVVLGMFDECRYAPFLK